ncbi:MAG: archaetidylserine decarboxylase [Gammaproteobacteria bacterium]|nr:archaetidylserine decarboxylase [Gammaproteobacteria bacterium]
MKTCLQSLIPQHALSRFLGKLANAKMGFITRFGIKQFIKHYKVNMAESKIEDYREFKTFNDFFTRELKSGARVISAENNVMISPVDGCVSELGYIEKDKLLQAKGAYFNLLDLCGGDAQLNKTFTDGAFLTIYLAPKDYHRYHMPISGKLLQMIYVPGDLFSVNQSSVKNVPGLFARNERVICIFETEIGKVALIAVGAMIVGSMSMNWHGIVSSKNRDVMRWDYADRNIQLQRGEEVGHFRLGSTVILLCEQNAVEWNSLLQAEKTLQLGEAIAALSRA